MSNNIESAYKFVFNRPQSVASYGYGSGLVPQASYSKKDNPQIDIILVVNDLKEWHLKNMKRNPKDYCFTGRLYLSISSISKIKGRNNITYFSQIEEGNKQFKYGVIELEDFKRSLSTWENIFIAGRFQKPTISIKTTPELNDIINQNRQYALAIACLFLPSFTDPITVLEKICSLSYAGDTRMLLAENPYKVLNIVLGNKDKLTEMYLRNNNFIKRKAPNLIQINHRYILENIDKLLPPALVDYLAEHDTNLRSITELRERINEYIREHNREESASQTLEGFKTNGIIRSVPYIKAKVKKRFSSVDITKKTY